MTAPRTLLLDDDGQPYRRRDGRLVYLIQGGSSPEAPAAPAQPPAAPAQQPPAQPAAAPPVVPPGATVAGQPGAAQAPQVPTWYADGPEAAQAYVDRVVREAAGHRTAKNELEQNMQAAIAAAVEKATADQAQAIGKAIGLIKDEAEQLTPEQLTQQAAQFADRETQYQKQIRELTMVNALSSALSGAHPGAKDALIGSGKLADLDPSADDFADQLKTRVTQYLDANPYLKVTTPVLPQAGSSGADFTGSTTPPGGAPSIDDLRAERAKRRAG